MSEDKNNKVEESSINGYERKQPKNYKTRDSFIAIDETGETEDKFIFAKIAKSYEIKDGYTDITKDHEGGYKDLVSKEIISNK